MHILLTPDTTTLSYWLNLRVFLCAAWIFSSIVAAFIIIWKYERLNNLKHNGGDNERDAAEFLSKNDVWKPCLKEIHPLWLLAFRVIAFCLLLAVLIAKITHSRATLFYFYTQWTFILVTFYFGFGSVLSIYGCYQYHKITTGSRNMHHGGLDAERANFVPPSKGESANIHELREGLIPQKKFEAAGFISYLFQVLFQMNAGVVMLTDSVYWFVIFPFLTIRDYELSFTTVIMHSMNAILLLGDTALNSLRFPWFRFSYFVLYTGVFVIFQWILHACVSIWWPYPFMDLSSPYAPIWYIFIGLMHIPCYGIFALFVKLKHYLLSKWFPRSYQL